MKLFLAVLDLYEHAAPGEPPAEGLKDNLVT